MITTVCLNPCIDRTVWLESFVPGATNRVMREESMPAGKGVNTARALAAQGVPVCVMLLEGADDAGKMEATLLPLGVKVKAVKIEGSMRVNVKVFDCRKDEITEINAAGRPVDEATVEEATRAILAFSQESRWLVLSGSMPPGFAPGYYARIIREVRKAVPTCKIALDAEGESFRLGIAEGPDFVKPNQHELSLFLGKEAKTRSEIIEGAKVLSRAGAKEVLVSMGSEGSLLYTGQVCLSAMAISVPVQTTVGSGDCMLSGYIAARCRGESAAAALRQGIAAATANVAGDIRRMDQYLAQITLSEESVG